VATELQRRIADALRMDSRVTGVRDYAFSFSEGVLSVSFVVTTVYGDLEEDMEVPLV
jgi:hypothetical protein